MDADSKTSNGQSNTYKYIYQLKLTPEIRTLETQFKALRQDAENNGWTYEHYREYTRIRAELGENCKESHSKNWNDKINDLVNHSTRGKEFWNKLNV